MWGLYTVDRFVSFSNSRLPGFNSRCWNPGSEAVDAFAVDWSGEAKWWCPLIGMIPRVIRHAQVCAALGTLIVPCWPSAFFWPLVCPQVGRYAHFVVRACSLPLSDSLFLLGLSGSVLFNGQLPNTEVLALDYDVSLSYMCASCFKGELVEATRLVRIRGPFGGLKRPIWWLCKRTIWWPCERPIWWLC